MGDAAGDHDRRAERQFERLVFFSDAVFAIAITVLVLDLKVRPGPHGELRLADSISSIVGFVLSFYVIGRYWMAHHALFGALHREDSRLRIANLVFLAFVVFLPFPTGVIASYPISRTAVVFYALSVAAVGLSQIVLCLAARRPALMLPGETRGGTALALARATPAPAVFLLSLAPAIFAPRLAAYFWLLLLPVGRVGEWIGKGLQRRIDARAAAPAST
jgi:uncharacterized membrane protein